MKKYLAFLFTVAAFMVGTAKADDPLDAVLDPQPGVKYYSAEPFPTTVGSAGTGNQQYYYLEIDFPAPVGVFFTTVGSKLVLGYTLQEFLDMYGVPYP